jgi:hypothetical protein
MIESVPSNMVKNLRRMCCTYTHSNITPEISFGSLCIRCAMQERNGLFPHISDPKNTFKMNSRNEILVFEMNLVTSIGQRQVWEHQPLVLFEEMLNAQIIELRFTQLSCALHLITKFGSYIRYTETVHPSLDTQRDSNCYFVLKVPSYSSGWLSIHQG